MLDIQGLSLPNCPVGPYRRHTSIRHIVVFSIAGGNEDELAGLVDDLEALPGRIDVIEALAVGRPLNETPFDCALTVDLADEDALEAYRGHPAHQPVLDRLRAVAGDVVVADIEV
jgi:hypothetical protein